MSFPSNALAAVTHPNPYPYYMALLDRPALHRDEALGLWIAARADAVTAVLAHPDCRVRPPTEPVPRALVGTPAGDIYAQLVRMTDGETHYTRKPAVAHRLRALDLATIAEESRRWAGRLPLDQLDALPVRVMAAVTQSRLARLRLSKDRDPHVWHRPIPGILDARQIQTTLHQCRHRRYGDGRGDLRAGTRVRTDAKRERPVRR